MTTRVIIDAGVPPADVLGPSATRMLFRVMTAGRPVSLRELSSEDWAHKCVRKLVRMGLVKRVRSAGPRRASGWGVVPAGMFKLELVRGSKP